MSNLDRTRDQINTVLNRAWNGEYLTASSLAVVQSKADQNETDIEALTDVVETFSGLATEVIHNTAGILSIDLGANRQTPVILTASVSQLNLTNGIVGRSYLLQISSDSTAKGFAFAPALDEADTTGIYNAGDVVGHPNGRVYKAASGTSGLRGVDFQADLSAGSWMLHIRTQNDDGYFPSQGDEDLLQIECIGTDYFKVIPHYGS